MYHFLRKQLTIFLLGFVVAFVVYLFVQFDVNKVVLGLVISAAVGVILVIALYFLERQFPEQIPGGDSTPH
jgi:hypothetical protein